MQKFLTLETEEAGTILDELLTAHPLSAYLIYTTAHHINAFPLICYVFPPCEDLESLIIPGQGQVLVEVISRLDEPEIRKIFSCLGIWSTMRIIDAFISKTDKD